MWASQGIFHVNLTVNIDIMSHWNRPRKYFTGIGQELLSMGEATFWKRNWKKVHQITTK